MSARQLMHAVAVGGTALAFIVVLLGAWTRLEHAGLGCPDWPGCYGFLTVPMASDDIATANLRFPEAPVEVHLAWPEMIHRYFASSLGVLAIGLVVLGWRSGTARGHAVGLLALVILQGLFGMWTVTLKLWPQVVTAHLLGGFTVLALLTLLAMRTRNQWPAAPGLVALRPHAAIALLVVAVQIALGGWTSSNYAALACVDLPRCHGAWWPAMDFARGFDLFQSVGPNYLGGLLDNDARVAIHQTHRLGAIVATVVVLALAVRLWRARSPGLALLLTTTLMLQVALGITNVLAHLPLAVATAHNGGGALLMLVLVAVNYRAASPGGATAR